MWLLGFRSNGGIPPAPQKEKCGEVTVNQTQNEACLAGKAAGAVQAGVGAVAGAACWGEGLTKDHRPLQGEGAGP